MNKFKYLLQHLKSVTCDVYLSSCGFNKIIQISIWLDTCLPYIYFGSNMAYETEYDSFTFTAKMIILCHAQVRSRSNWLTISALEEHSGLARGGTGAMPPPPHFWWPFSINLRCYHILVCKWSLGGAIFLVHQWSLDGAAVSMYQWSLDGATISIH